MENYKACVLVVDDDMRMRKAIGDYLRRMGYLILEAENGEQALAAFYAQNNIVDLILLDIMMPKVDGFTVLEEIRAVSQAPIIMLTARDGEQDQVAGFSAGVDDYIVKPFSPTLLLARIDSLLRRAGKNLTAEYVAVGALTFYLQERRVYCGGSQIKLSPKEYELLDYFRKNQGIALSREQIVNAVWSYDYLGDSRTVDTHIKQLRSKLTEKNPYIKTVRGFGYLFEVEP